VFSAKQLYTHDKTTLHNKFTFYFWFTQIYVQPIGLEAARRPMEVKPSQFLCF